VTKLMMKDGNLMKLSLMNNSLLQLTNRLWKVRLQSPYPLFNQLIRLLRSQKTIKLNKLQKLQQLIYQKLRHLKQNCLWWVF